jgi:serine/threonine-protein kinase RsbT
MPRPASGPRKGRSTAAAQGSPETSAADRFRSPRSSNPPYTKGGSPTPPGACSPEPRPSLAPRMTTAYQQLLEVLLRYLSPTNAEGTLQRTIREAGLRPEEVSYSDFSQILPSLERRIRLYVDPGRHIRIVAELADVGGNRPSRRSRVVVIKLEPDISEARRVAKAICEGVGARGYITHKVVTIVSELARNIVHYTPGGTIEVGVIRDKPLRISVIASDSGPGIKNLDEIMSGTYKSKTGMGRGIMGVKRLAERFKINPGPPGVRIDLEVML